MVEIKKIISLLPLALLILPLGVSAATLSITPTSGTFEVGDTITTRVVVASDLSINAVSGILSIPPIFTIESVSKSASILNFWVSEPNFSRGAGTLQFEGVTLGGYNGKTGTVITFILRANKEGSGSISFISGQVLANDGQGTNLTSGLGNSSFLVKAKEVKPTSPETTEKPTTTQEVLEIDKAEPPQEPPTLKAPEIKLSKILTEEVVAGISSYPNSQVLITFTSENDIKVFVQGNTDAVGNFVIPIPQTLKHGLYKISVVIIKEDLSHSTPSNEITVTIGNLLSDVGVEIKTLIGLLALIALYLIIRVHTYFIRTRATKKHLEQETKEAQSVVRKAFKLLDKDISNLASIREIKKDLKTSEKIIIEEIKDIEES